MRIRILLLIKVMRIGSHWSAGLPRLHFEPLKLMGFDFNANPNTDPGPAFHTNAGPNPLQF
jgi:hypothetical protein